MLSISNPPPPVDIDTIDPPAECEEPTDCPALVSIGGRYFRNPNGSLAWATFSSFPPIVEVSPDAQVRDNGEGLIGRGTIVTDIFLGGDPTPNRIRIDLATAQGSLLVSPRPGFREVTFSAQAIFLSTGLPVPGGVVFYFGY
jgi:hypothetical protein